MRNIKEHLKREIIVAGKRLYKDDALDFDTLVTVEHPPPHFQADYASSVPLRLAKSLHKNPQKIAEEYIAELKKSKYISENFSSIKDASGFLNFIVKNAVLINIANTMRKTGSSKFVHVGADDRKKYLNEFISANPTGPLTLGNARGAFLGSVLSNILRRAGHVVENEYYINNAKSSKQIRELGRTFLGQAQSYLTPWLEGVINVVKQEQRMHKLNGDPKEAGFALAQTIQKHNQEFIKDKLGIEFNKWFSEEGLYRAKDIKKTLAMLESRDFVYEKDGATWFKTSEHGDDEDRVLVRSDGEATYFLTDIAYHLNKYARGYDVMIDIWGADHQGHVKRLHAALRAIGEDEKKLHIIITQIVRLVEGGEAAKMSKRAGMYVTLEELMGEVDINVARFFFLMRSADAHIDFDLNLAKEKSQQNPVYYIQYAYVRASRVIQKARRNFQFSSHVSVKNVFIQEERALIIRLLEFPELVYDISVNMHVHTLTTYVTDLARDFHNFYEHCPVIQEKNRRVRRARLALCIATKRILEEALDTMDIDSPKQM